MTDKIPEYEFIPNAIYKYTPKEVTEKVLETLTNLSTKIRERGVNRAEWTYSPIYTQDMSGVGELFALEFNLRINFHTFDKTARNENE